MKAIKTPVVLSLLLTLAAGAPLVSQAQQETPKPGNTTPAPIGPAITPILPPAPAVPKKPLQQTLNGRVVSIDRFNRSVTLAVNNLTYVLQITDSTRLSRNGQEQNMADFVVGEEITVNVMLRELANGRIEVAVLAVEMPTVAAAQGKAKGNGYAKGGDFTTPPPFINGPNPGNVDGPVVSRNR
jgi:hypothetical protein